MVVLQNPTEMQSMQSHTENYTHIHIVMLGCGRKMGNNGKVSTKECIHHLHFNPLSFLMIV